MSTQIKEIVEAVSNSYGDEFFTKITLALSKAVNADYVFIGRINAEAYVCETESLVAKGKIAENFEYPLKGTPCANVADNSVCYYPKNVCHYYPDDQLLVDMNIEAYLGTPLLDSKQNVIGLVTALFEKEHTEKEDTSALLQLFSGRIAAELERIDYEQSLEDKITERTAELSNIVKELQITQRQLVESEKMSALGNLVAGVSHEVNTPLGISITTHSVITDALQQLADKVESKHLSNRDMEHFINTTDSALNIQGENLLRAKDLIENFKKTAADQHQLEIEKIDISLYYQQVISTLQSILKPKKVNLVVNCDKQVTLATYPGVHAQILTNLINNSVKHGFLMGEHNGQITSVHLQENTITITIKQAADDEVTVIYQDNGQGLTPDTRQHIFEPFFTTARANGGIGLGMSIVFNLINKRLNGSIACKEVETGAYFQYTFKESV